LGIDDTKIDALAISLAIGPGFIGLIATVFLSLSDKENSNGTFLPEL